MRDIACVIVLLTSLIAFLCPFQVRAAGEPETEDNVLHLSMEQGRLMVLHRNLDIIIRLIDPQIEEARIESAKGVFDPVISGSYSHEDASVPLTTRSSVAAGGRSTVDSETSGVSAGISGKLSPGTEYGVEFENEWTRNTFNDFQSEYDAFAGIRVTQPLLRDFGSGINRFEIEIARRNRDLSIQDVRQRVTDIMVDYKNAYWDLVLAAEELSVREEALRLSESLLELSRKKLQAEVVPPLEVTQAEAGVASRREDVIIARRNKREKENALKRLISDNIAGMKDVTVIPVDTPVVMPVDTGGATVQTALEHRPDYLKQKIELEKSGITVRYSENQEYPDIDLEATYGYNGLANSFENSIDDMGDYAEWSLGVVFRYPLGNRTAAADTRISKLEGEKALLNMKNIEQRIILELDNAVSRLETDRLRIGATEESTRLAEASLRAEELKLKEGLSTSHDVLEFQEDLAEARLREISAVIDYKKSEIELSRVLGTLPEKEGIRFENGKINGEAEGQ